MKNKENEIKAAFVVVFSKKQKCDHIAAYEIGLAHEGVKGYSPGYGNFDDPNITYNEACEEVRLLNSIHYGHTPLEAAKIVMSTMF